MSAMNLSRFADPSRTSPVALGPCRCPGSPHEADSAEVRAEIGDGELRAATARGGFRSGGMFNGADSDNECVATFTTSWTLQLDDGKPAPLLAEFVALLDEATRQPLLDAISKASDRRPLPNASGAPSRGPSRGSASQSRGPKRT